jgi:hypothetical protein
MSPSELRGDYRMPVTAAKSTRQFFRRPGIAGDGAAMSTGERAAVVPL